MDISFPEVAAPKPETAVAAAVQDADASQDISETAVEDALEDFADEEPKLVQTLPQSEEAPAPLPQTSPSPAADAAEINEEDLRELVRYGDFPAETFSFPGVQPVHFDVSEAPQSEEFKGGDLPAEETDSRAGEEADWQTAERVPSPPDVSVDFLALEETRKVDALLQREGFSQKEAQTETDNIVQLEQADLAANTEITELPAMAERRDADMLAEGEWDTEEKEASASKTAAVEFGEQDPEQTIVPEPVLTVQQSAQEKPVARANRAQVLQEKLKIVAGKVAAKLDILLAGADAALGKGADKLIVAVRRLKNVNRGTQVVSRAVVPQEKPPAVGSDSISGEQGKHAAEINIKQDVEQIKAAKKPAEKKSAALIQMAGIVEEQNDAVRDAAAGKKARIVKSFAEAGLDNSATAEKIAGDVKAPAGSARSRAAMIDELINEHSFSSDEDAISPNGALVNSRSRKEEMLFGKQRRKPLT
ncbi:MAG TPA: hypothetical protein PLP17_13150, partial [Oligoflexia bacterium]|nr:hypothetical protein [Oligoflexia bacterium]